MLKIKKFIKSSNLIMRLIYCIFTLKTVCIRSVNKLLPPKYIDIGSGKNMAEIGWSNIDVQEDGEVISETTRLQFETSSIDFIYSSHFFEHIDEATAENLLHEAYRVLKPGGVLRIVVPNQQFFIDEYRLKNYDYLKARIREENLNTWDVYGTDINSPEQLLIGVIAGIHNKEHRLTIWPFKEDARAEIPIFTYPFQSKMPGFYCGPPPYISNDLIREKLELLSTHEFCLWLFSLGKKSDITKGIFATWHKNDWPFEKFLNYGNSIGFTSIDKSEYGKFNFQILSQKKREAYDKKPLSLYVNFIK
jgi:SAM-dependent methyltransferase